MRLFTFTLLAFIFLSTSVFAQDDKEEEIDKVPDNAKELYDYVEEVLLVYKRESMEDLMDRFKDDLKVGKVSNELCIGIAGLLTEMNQKGMKRYNFYAPVIETMLKFADDSGLASQHFNRWISISKALLADQPQNKTSDYERYLKFSKSFWLSGNLYDISRGSHKWRASSRAFQMKYEDKVISMEYNNTDLYCYNKSDSLTIKDVSGTFYPIQGVWLGKTGTVQWTSKGAESAYAIIKDFTLQFKHTSYTAKKATLHYDAVFGKPIDGILKDRIIRRSRSNLRYPKFESKSRNIEMTDIGEGVSYVGGFQMQGAKVKGYGDRKGLSSVYIKDKQGRKLVKVESAYFDILKGDKVVSKKAKVTLYIHNEDGSLDSIYHPSSEFIYSIVDRRVEVDRGDARISQVKFSNSLTQMDMDVPSIKWAIDTDKMELGDNQQNMEMSSENHFDKGLYEKYHNIISINPIIKFAHYSSKIQQSIDENGGNFEGENTDDEQMSDEELDDMFGDPEPFPEDGGTPPEEELDTAFLKSIGAWPPADADTDEETTAEEGSDEVDDFLSEEDLIDYGPRLIDAAELATLLDRRMEKLNILTSKEIEKASKNPAFKIIKNEQDYQDFKRNYPIKYKFGAIDVYNLFSVVPNSDIDVSTALPLYMEMVKDGFILYDNVNKTVTLREKLFHYAASVNPKKLDHDFDNIKIESIPTRTGQKKHESNAVFNLKEAKIETFGVQSFVLSDSQQVVASPFKGEVQMKKGRDMDFDGVMTGGNCKFTGEDFHFKYDIFHVEMDSIDFFDMFIYKRARWPQEAGRLAGRPKKEREVDFNGKPTTEKEPIKSVIEGGAGVLLIDVPSNKSGRSASDPMYPSFEAIKASRVYYDKRNRQGEQVYPREDFYYELEPFILNGLDDVTPDDLVFQGKLQAADIFEPINEPLRVMYHDLSLGFETETRGNEANPVYIRDDKNGKGTFKGAIGISNEGLIGNGRLDYLGATIESEYIEFLPEQFKSDEVDSFKLAEGVVNGVEYPKVKGEKVLIDWAPYSDSMHIESTLAEGAPFEFFDSTDFNLDGSLTLTPEGLLGRGVFDWHGATLESNPGGDFVFGKRKITSESAGVNVKNTGELDFAFENENVKAVIDFDKMTGDFSAIEQDLSTDLTYNSFQTSLDKFHWDMKNDHIIMESQDGKTGFFLATEESSDSLVFEGKVADYDLNSGLLKIDSVEFIRIADAFIYPENKHVEVEKDAKMRLLENSKIICDTLNQNHVIQRATINVISRSEYKADGFLEFNIKDHKEQEIKFSDVHVRKLDDGQIVTEGRGTVSDTLDFYVDKRTRFKGDITLLANSNNLTFEGFAKISSSVIPTQEWFGIDSKIDKNDVSIEYENPKNPNGSNLYVGIFLDMDSMHVYPSILAPKKKPDDRSIFTTTGVLKFDNQKDMYLFGDSLKVLGENVLGKAQRGKLMTVEEKNAKVTAEGQFDFNKGFARVGPTVTVDVVGNFSFYLNKESDFSFESSMNFDFYLPKTLRDVMVKDLQSAEELIDRLMYTSIKNKHLQTHMKNFIEDDRRYDKMWKRVESDERMQLPNDFDHAFFFVNNPLVWSPKTQSFVTKGRRLQLASIGGKHIGQIVKGHIEILNDPARGDQLTFYLISPQGDWYYFSYQAGFLKTISSNPDYTNAISSLKKKERRVKTANGQYIEVVIGSPSEYSSFKNKASAAFR